METGIGPLEPGTKVVAEIFACGKPEKITGTFIGSIPIDGVCEIRPDGFDTLTMMVPLINVRGEVRRGNPGSPSTGIIQPKLNYKKK